VLRCCCTLQLELPQHALKQHIADAAAAQVVCGEPVLIFIVQVILNRLRLLVATTACTSKRKTDSSTTERADMNINKFTTVVYVVLDQLQILAATTACKHIKASKQIQAGIQLALQVFF
jgi:hypothetical protein